MSQTATIAVDTAIEPEPLLTVQERVQAIIKEMCADIKERESVIHDMWVARVGQLHLLMLGPGGSGKSFMVRRMCSHILGSIYFESALDETSDPSMVFGPPNIKKMVEDGRSTFIVDGMFPECTEGFLDEFFNGNKPLLHALQPPLNERIFHNGGVVTPIPLKSCFMGTNLINPDVTLAPLFDRIHIRHVVNYVEDRQNRMDLVADTVARMALNGRGTTTLIPGQTKTTVTVEELDEAFVEALSLPVPPIVQDTFEDIRDELANGKAQVQISDRRAGESMVAVMANAWVRGRSQVEVADLDVLANMWWTVQEQRGEVRAVVLAATNPSEKAALDLLEELDKIREEIAEASKPETDPSIKKRVGIEQVKNLDRLLDEAALHLDTAKAAGATTTRIEEVIIRTTNFKVQVGKDFFGIDGSAQAQLANAANTP